MKLARQRMRGRTALAVSLATGVLLAIVSACSTTEPATTPAAGERETPAPQTARASRRCTRYAAPWGRDSSRGTARRPFRTAQRLADSLRPGDTGCLRGGVYDETSDGYVLKVERGGRRGAPIRIRSFPRERAKLVGVVWVVDGANHVMLSNLAIQGAPGEITFKIYSDDVVVAKNDITNLRRGKSCMILGSTSGYGQAARTVVHANRFHDCGRPEDDNLGHGIYAQSVVDARISRNVFWRIQAYAIQFYPYAQRTRFTNNIVDGGPPSVRGGVLFGGNEDFASTGNIVERNVIAYAQTSAIASGWDDDVGSGNLAARNCVWGAREGNIDDSDGGFVARGNVVAPPLFVNRARRDYRLSQASRCRRVVGPRAAAGLGDPRR